MPADRARGAVNVSPADAPPWRTPLVTSSDTTSCAAAKTAAVTALLRRSATAARATGGAPPGGRGGAPPVGGEPQLDRLGELPRVAWGRLACLEAARLLSAAARHS